MINIENFQVQGREVVPPVTEEEVVAAAVVAAEEVEAAEGGRNRTGLPAQVNNF